MQPGPSKDILRFTGHRHLRQRILLSILSGKSIRIDGIRSDDVHVGLRDYEVNLLRLVEKVTNGSTIEISVTGTSFILHPGLLPGGSFTHSCHIGRSIGYYLEVLLPLAPFCKKPFNITLYGVTGEEGRDLTVDMIRTVTLPHLHLFGISEGLELQIKKRGSAPLGGGQVFFKCPIVRQLNTLHFVDKGKIKKIRGVSYSTRVSPQFANRMVESARSVLNRYVPDVYLYTDVYKGDDSGKSPGYGLTLVTQSTTSAVHSAESLSVAGEVTTPEDIALFASRLLLEELSRGGCIDSKHQWLVALLMALGKEDVSKCLFGSLTPYTVQFFRDMFAFFGTKYKISEESSGEVLVSCIGIGYSNVNKSMA
ncbi:18S rRNA biogenesis protein RCL1 [Cryptococcus neoformans]|nr:18S rRNA biogenesis protein RCL1 [Cryptococcus neoformans var. grubii Bt1]OWZ61767.1 18S rRNA biogenesis protein RCL1 [Cryptococcus neoformans var. grubii]OXG15349.1 18S rRNA biogenesis protein RCL1 [Cryptococcus neoformans var. grubii Tu401-1]OXG20918.1 18S rRNA biogenesis protein RCL1 [Cryptococcus neoformans var. grubii Ze90-1]OXM78043.1 18S rRNA biogenesis protein RCL1 [Cryptococcus neoformans var. grubii Bt63]